ncbi:unnamed protein product [Ceratitis capitata]|uniref:(Mediterranean fruit fly) hypothetical protein n=1 Tax=Ceratitis capitata TaxID=7213 RepID=A0A811V6X3_CERCA|nr:unnamed protein product [Ceratitis capitata]
MHNVNNVLDQHNIGVSPHLKTHVGVLNYSPPSPASSLSSESLDGDINSPGPCSPASAAARLHGSNDGDDHFCTPKKSLADSGVLGRIRVKLGTPGVLCEMHALSTEQRANVDTAKLFKNRFLLSTSVHKLPLSHAAKTPASYRHLVGLTTSTLKCTDVFTNAEYGCKVINEPFPKVQRAYYDIKCAGELARSSLYGHTLIRDVHEIVPADKSRSYLVIAPPKAEEGAEGVFEDLHTYMRQCRRLCDKEAKALFHQIAETVLLCHKNGIILRDLKLKRFFFIDQARLPIAAPNKIADCSANRSHAFAITLNG